MTIIEQTINKHCRPQRPAVTASILGNLQKAMFGFLCFRNSAFQGLMHFQQFQCSVSENTQKHKPILLYIYALSTSISFEVGLWRGCQFGWYICVYAARINYRNCAHWSIG